MLCDCRTLLRCVPLDHLHVLTLILYFSTQTKVWEAMYLLAFLSFFSLSFLSLFRLSPPSKNIYAIFNFKCVCVSTNKYGWDRYTKFSAHQAIFLSRLLRLHYHKIWLSFTSSSMNKSMAASLYASLAWTSCGLCGKDTVCRDQGACWQGGDEEIGFVAISWDNGAIRVSNIQRDANPMVDTCFIKTKLMSAGMLQRV